MLNLDFWNVLWTIVNLLILSTLVRLFLFRPIHKVLEARKKEIDDGYAQAREAKDAAEGMKQQYEISMAQIKDEKHKILVEANDRAGKEYDRIVEEAQLLASKKMQQAQ
ncbi:MAG: ATP synthase F0 subunit B, partial [Lachnospiraceae bacterium]|nr:ATP synthase F0 subunit B [Lachnospiraceae bacterium]